MNISAVLVVIVCFIAVLVILLFVLSAAENRISALRAALRKARTVKGSELVCEEAYFRIVSGRASLVNGLPSEETVKEEVAEPVTVEAYDETAATETDEEDPEHTRAVERLAEKYGDKLTENSRIIEITPPDVGSFADKFSALADDERRRYNDFTAYVLAKPNVTMTQNKNNVTFKYRTDRIFSIVIRRSVPVVLFKLVNTELRRFIKDEDVKNIKVRTVDIRLASDGELSAAKQTADIAAENSEADYVYRKERRKELRAAKRGGKTDALGSAENG